MKNALPVWKARPDVPKEKKLIDMVNETCKQLDIKKPPNLFIFDDSRRQLSGGAGFINTYFFSQSALDILSHDQLKAVIAHEMTHRKHLARETTIVTSGLAVIVPLFLIIGSSVLSPVIAIPAIIGLFMASLFGGLWYRRRMEREADVGGAEIAGPQAMIDALRVVEKQKDEIHGENLKNLAKHVPPFLKPYPTIDERIKHIQKQTPLKAGSSTQPEVEMPQNNNQEEVAQYTVSAMQSKAFSDPLNTGCEGEKTVVRAPTRSP